MILDFKSRKKTTDASARVVDGKLILSLPDAKAPIVWQMDLAHAKASALEVRNNEEAGEFNLTLKTPKGETVEVAVFEDRTDAVEGLMAVSNALENAHGQIRSQAAPPAYAAPANDAPQAKKETLTPKAKRNRLVTGLLAMVVLFILFTIWSSVIPQTTQYGASVSATSATGIAPQNSSGVPISADAFLNGQ